MPSFSLAEAVFDVEFGWRESSREGVELDPMTDDRLTTSSSNCFIQEARAAVAVCPPESEPTSAQRSQAATIRVLHVINGEHYAGAERVQDLLALRLPEFGVEASF